MAEAEAQLSLVPADTVQWSVEHAIPGRLRIRADALLADRARGNAFRQSLLRHPGISTVEVKPQIGTATVRYVSRRLSRRELDTLVYNGLVTTPQAAPTGSPGIGGDMHLGLLLAGLAVTPMLPLPLRYAVTVAGVGPTLWQAAQKLQKGGSASRILDSSALLLSTLAGRYGVAQINNFMHTLGHKMEQRAVRDTEAELRLHGMPPIPRYPVIRGGEPQECPTEELLSGDRLTLAVDQLVPLEALVIDGVGRVRCGFSSDAIEVAPGYRLSAGSQLLEGELTVACLQDWDQGSYARLAGFIEIAIRSRENHEDYAARLADRLVPFTMILSAAVYGFTKDLARVSSAMQADFGAANELVTPVSVESTIATGARSGILFRGGAAIERLAELDTLVFDRTGTVTRGEWYLAELLPQAGYSEAECRDMLGRLVTTCCRTGVIEASDVMPPLVTLAHAEIHEIEDHGLHLRQDGVSLGLTNVATAVDHFGVQWPQALAPVGIGVTACLLVDGACACIVRFSDSLSAGAAGALQALRSQGVKRLYLVSHEREESLHPEISELPLDALHTELTELEKLQFIQDLLDDGRKVGVVSDGLLRASGDCLNICLGTSRDARPLDADLWLMPEDIERLARAHRLARRSTRKLRHSHRGSQASKGAALLASSFDLLPPSVAAALGSAVTLGLMNRARNNRSGDLV